MERFWYTIRTKPNKENVAAYNYQNQGYEIYLPQVLKTIKHARQVKKVNKPFFPGYLFIRLSKNECNWQKISNTRGSIAPVKFGDQYPIIADQVIDNLQNLENKDGYIDINIFVKDYNPGQKVRFIDGNFEGLEGIFYSQNGHDRAIILLEFLGKITKTYVPLHLLQAS